MQNRTDRIVFKLFGKGPSDFPFVVRTQVLNCLMEHGFNFVVWHMVFIMLYVSG